MKTLTLNVNFDKDLDPDRIAAAREVFRSQIECHLLNSGQGPDGAWGYGRSRVCSVDVAADESTALNVLRQLHRFLHPELYPEHERPEGARSDWTSGTLEAVDTTIRQAVGGDPRVRTEMRAKLAWVLLTGDPRTGFEVIGTFSHPSGAEAHASSWNHTDWWPLPLLDRLEAPAHRVTLLRA